MVHIVLEMYIAWFIFCFGTYYSHIIHVCVLVGESTDVLIHVMANPNICTGVYRCHWCQFGFGINTHGTDSKCL